VNAAFRSAYGRPPSPAELRDSTEFLQTRRATIPRETPRHLSPYRPDRQALADLCHALLNSNEFLHVD
jgi:hypothetical protein